MANKTLREAKKNKTDEFYTRLEDIEEELRNYKQFFENKIVLCNCDDPFESNFFKYFALNFNHLKLKKLIATCYDSSPIAFEQESLFSDLPRKMVLNNNRKAYKIEITEVKDYNDDGAIDLSDVRYLLKNNANSLSLLRGNGDFRSEECVALLDEADVVVTNPPFSLFREYVALLVKYNKKFIIIGNKNAITYKEIFPLIMDGKMWLGYRNVNADMWFIVPKDYKYEKVIDGHNVKHIMGCWFTNIDTTKRHEQYHYTKSIRPKSIPNTTITMR